MSAMTPTAVTMVDCSGGLAIGTSSTSSPQRDSASSRCPPDRRGLPAAISSPPSSARDSGFLRGGSPGSISSPGAMVNSDLGEFFSKARQEQDGEGEAGKGDGDQHREDAAGEFAGSKHHDRFDNHRH